MPGRRIKLPSDSMILRGHTQKSGEHDIGNIGQKNCCDCNNRGVNKCQGSHDKDTWMCMRHTIRHGGKPYCSQH